MNRIQGILGLAKKAGALEVGTNNVLAAIRSNKALLVLIADNSSQGTIKLITDKATYRNVPVETAPFNSEELGHCVGKTNTVAVAFTKEGFIISYRKALDH